MHKKPETLSDLLDRLGWTAWTASQASGLAYNSVKSWVAGQARPWRAKAEQLAEALGVDTQTVLAASSASRRKASKA